MKIEQLQEMMKQAQAIQDRIESKLLKLILKP